MMSGSLIGGCVYLARTPGLPFVKIGMTRATRETAPAAVAARLGKLQRGCPLKLELAHFAYVDDAPGVEAELLRRFAQARCFGEWVKVSRPGALVRELKRLASEWAP